jgi:UDP-N-acetylglucosamine--N-acetylmuramyl-(pentapeptide) pyrophosphoryl-undecaprenol N-acetylglucosamine transferase
LKTILIMAGGTGGHIFPGLAVAEQMRAAGWDVVWMGARGGMEERLVPRHGYRTAWIRARAARGKGLAQKLLLPANLLYSYWESARYIRSLKPDVVLGLGGYVAFPGGMMASLLNRPLALHEQNAIAGLANRVLAQVSDKVMVAFPDALKGGEWTGNPVRSEIAAVAAPENRFQGRKGAMRILVVGGSLGAQALNEALPKALALMNEKPQVVHQAGEKHLESLKNH